MIKRIITAVCATMLLIPICIFSNTIVFPITFAGICAIGVYEMAKCLGMQKNIGICIPFYILAVSAPVLRWFIDGRENIWDTPTDGCEALFFGICMIALFGALIYCMCYVMFRRNKDKITDIMSLFALCMYVIASFASIVVLRYMEKGKYIYLLVFIGAWMCDTFAYFVGRFFGRHKLIPEISPKKTIEGSIGGIVFTPLFYIGYGFIVNHYFEDANLSIVKLGISALFVAVVSQIGDLVASAVKRQYDIKDFGFVFPGHGGVLDRFDSVMLVSPFLIFFNMCIGF